MRILGQAHEREVKRESLFLYPELGSDLGSIGAVKVLDVAQCRSQCGYELHYTCRGTTFDIGELIHHFTIKFLLQLIRILYIKFLYFTRICSAI